MILCQWSESQVNDSTDGWPIAVDVTSCPTVSRVCLNVSVRSYEVKISGQINEPAERWSNSTGYVLSLSVSLILVSIGQDFSQIGP